MPGKEKRTTIAFIVPNLMRGGAERVLVNLVNNIDLVKFEPIIFCQRKEGELLAAVRQEVLVVDLNAPRVYFIYFALRKALKKYKPDILTGWMGHINGALSFWKPFFSRKLIMLCRESSIPSKFISFYKFPGLFRFFYKHLHRLDGVICQSAAMKEDLVSNFSFPESKATIIFNPVVKPSELVADSRLNDFADGSKMLLFVGRFSKEKRPWLCLDVLENLPAEYKLVMVGYGSFLATLNESIAAKGLAGRVLLIADCNNPAYFYSKADCLLLTSDFEGFPNVLLEANTAGCPAVVYETEGGAKEIITPKNGAYLLAGTSLREFAQKIQEVCTRPDFKNKQVLAVQTQEKYGVGAIVKTYENYFLSFIQTR